MNKKFGLIGKKLSHSLSAQVHSLIYSNEYKLYELDEGEISDFFQSSGLDGFNVTIPYKKTVIPFLDDISNEAKKLGAVNTVVKKDGKYFGYNTDYFGLTYLLHRSEINVRGKKCLVSGGNGGAGQTAVRVLEDNGASQVIVVSRSGEVNYDNIYTLHPDAQIIVNATPVGMYPKNGLSPLDISQFNNLNSVLDLIYNPLKTELLLQAEDKGIKAVNGLGMLVAQAFKSAEYFTEKTYPQEKIDSAVSKMYESTVNIVFIGMPGVGKSTVGKKIAETTGRRFIDLDVAIEERYGKAPAEIISNAGVKKFRALETKVIKSFTNEKNLVISCGGGAVTEERNYPLLKQNGLVVYMKAEDIESLPTYNRPISRNRGLREIYEERAPYYERFADITVDVKREYVDEDIRNILKEINAYINRYPL